MRAYTIYWKNEQREPDIVLADAVERDWATSNNSVPPNFTFLQWQLGGQPAFVAFAKYEDVLRITSELVPDEPLPGPRRK